MSHASLGTSQELLGKLKHAASMAISVTTGKKLTINKNEKASNIIPGFGYALMDIFENDFVDMESIARAKDQIEEANKRSGNPQFTGNAKKKAAIWAQADQLAEALVEALKEENLVDVFGGAGVRFNGVALLEEKYHQVDYNYMRDPYTDDIIRTN